MKIKRFSSRAWLMRGISALPGELELRHGRLSFTAWGPGSMWPFQLRKLGRELALPALEAELPEWPCRLFRWQMTEVTAVFPWYMLSAGTNLFHQGWRARISFGEPQQRILRHNPVDDVMDLQKIGPMRKLGKSWYAVMEDWGLLASQR